MADFTFWYSVNEIRMRFEAFLTIVKHLHGWDIDDLAGSLSVLQKSNDPNWGFESLPTMLKRPVEKLNGDLEAAKLHHLLEDAARVCDALPPPYEENDDYFMLQD